MTTAPKDDRPTLRTPPPEFYDAERTTNPSVPVPGTRISDTYVVERTLGRGGMGVVLLATDERLERKVAIKIIDPDFAHREKALARFLKEARTMAGLRHQNVVQIFALGEHDGAPYFVMEYVEGSTLADWLLRHAEGGAPPQIDEAIGILEQVCRGLSAIHDIGIVHGDIKPGNILIGPLFRVAVTDFGLVRDRDSVESGAHVVGTPAYIAPEVVTSADPALRLTASADIYALGVMAYEMLTGVLPWPIADVHELFETHLRAKPVEPPSEVRTDLSPAFDRVVLRALERDPEARYPSADAFRRELMRARETVARPRLAIRVVVADDDEAFLELATKSAELAFPGAEVERFRDGHEALRHLDRGPATLAIIDLDVPGMNGLELTAAIRATEHLRHMPILIVTSSGGADEWRLLSSLGADGFLLKPIDPYALVALTRRTVGVSMFPPARGPKKA